MMTFLRRYWVVSNLECIWDLTASIFFTLSIQACLSKYKMIESTQGCCCMSIHFCDIPTQLSLQGIPHCRELQCVTFVLITHTCKCESYKCCLEYFVVASSNWKYVSVPYVDHFVNKGRIWIWDPVQTIRVVLGPCSLCATFKGKL